MFGKGGGAARRVTFVTTAASAATFSSIDGMGQLPHRRELMFSMTSRGWFPTH